METEVTYTFEVWRGGAKLGSVEATDLQKMLSAATQLRIPAIPALIHALRQERPDYYFIRRTAEGQTWEVVTVNWDAGVNAALVLEYGTPLLAERVRLTGNFAPPQAVPDEFSQPTLFDLDDK